jgi:hypothetical protein
MKNIHALCLCFLLLACAPETDSLQWYENQTIEQITADTDSTYLIQIGIMAQAFHLNRQDDDFENKLLLLEESLSQRKKLAIGVKKGTANIISVRK